MPPDTTANTLLGVGSSLIETGGSIGLTAVKNKGDEIRADYQLQMQKLLNDSTLSTAQQQLAIQQLNNDRDTKLAEYTAQAKHESLILYGVLGGLAMVLILSVVLLIRKKSVTPTYTPQR